MKKIYITFLVILYLLFNADLTIYFVLIRKSWCYYHFNVNYQYFEYFEYNYNFY